MTTAITLSDEELYALIDFQERMIALAEEELSEDVTDEDARKEIIRRKRSITTYQRIIAQTN